MTVAIIVALNLNECTDKENIFIYFTIIVP
jgi:hypothetical protein